MPTSAMNATYLNALNASDYEDIDVINATRSNTVNTFTKVALSTMTGFGLASFLLHCTCLFVVYRARLLSTDVKLLLYNVSFAAAIAKILIVWRAIKALVHGADDLQQFTTVECIREHIPYAVCAGIVQWSVIGIGVERWLTNRTYFKLQPEDPPATNSWRVGAVAVGLSWLTGILMNPLFVACILLYVDNAPPTRWCGPIPHMIVAAPLKMRIIFPIIGVGGQLFGLVTFEYVSRRAQQMYDAYRQGATQNLETRFYLKQSTRLSSSLRLCFRLFVALGIVARPVMMKLLPSDEKTDSSSPASALRNMVTLLVLQFPFSIVFPCALLACTEPSSSFVRKWLCCCCWWCCRNKVDPPSNEGAKYVDNDQNNGQENIEMRESPPEQSSRTRRETSAALKVDVAIQDLEPQ